MKVGIITASLLMETKDALRKAKDMGAHGVQLWVANNDLDPSRLSQSGRQELLTFMDGIGLERSALCGDIGGFANPVTVDENVSRTKAMFDLCVDLKTPILTTHVGVLPKDKSSKDYAGLLAAVREVAVYAAERECCFANETGLESGPGLAAFLDAIGSEGAQVNFDPANLCMNGFDVLEAVGALGGRIVHTHAKDGVFDSAKTGFQEVPLGEGDVDFPIYLKALRDTGFDGYLTIERECGDDPVGDIAAAIAFLKAQDGVEQ